MLSENISRSISAENPHGEKGKGAMEIPADEANPAFDLGRGWNCLLYTSCLSVRSLRKSFLGLDSSCGKSRNYLLL